jgi:NAD(P)-dependent dehydrogenase (short-subunit alcohol dehydrogenase family)
MSPEPLRRTVRFTDEDLDLFAAASHDRNPLHLSSEYARRTPYGQRVVHGALAALAALGGLEEAPGRALASASFDFEGAIFTEIDYDVQLTQTGDAALLKLLDGRRVLLKGSVRFRPSQRPARDEAAAGEPAAPRREAVDRAPGTLVPALTVRGRWAPGADALRALASRLGLDRRVRPADAAALSLCSYLVGMELPGRRALLARLSLENRAANHGMAFDYSAEVLSFDERFDLVKLAASLAAEDGEVTAKLAAFVRRDTPSVVDAELRRSDELAGKVALVVGASRGLGASIARALALRGCTVFASYARSQAEAEALGASLRDGTGKLILAPGNAADPAWCAALAARIARDAGRLDYLVCSACPSLNPLSLAPSSVERINDYVKSSLALVSAPLAAFLDLLGGGCAVVVSSAALRAPPVEWPHYVAAKGAIEALVAAAAAGHRSTRFLVVRPPRMWTDLVNTPLGRQGALAPAAVASRILERLVATRDTARPEVLESF